jgi:resuscitation-promoting factor RpfB
VITPTRGIIAAAILFFTGFTLLALAAWQPVMIFVDGQPFVKRTFALSVDAALQSADIKLEAHDRIQPSLGEPIGRPRVITIQRASEILIMDILHNQQIALSSAERIPANLLAEAGIPLYPKDILLKNDLPLPPDHPLPLAPSHTLQIKSALRLDLLDLESGDTTTFYSNATSLGDALIEAGIEVDISDSLSIPLDTPLNAPLSMAFQRAAPLKIQIGQNVFDIRSSAATVGQALAENNIALQGLDFSNPTERQPLPADGLIQVIRVREEVVLDETPLPYDIERQPDPQRDTGEEWVITPGIEGLQYTLYRLRFENDQQISSHQDAQWIAQPAQNEIMGYGTRSMVASDPGIEGLEYWGTKTMYATSYYPCGFLNRCSYTTASGATLQKGIVAFTVEWYRELKGTQVYVPGYGIGTVSDTGGGIPGKDWIDLGYGNEDYIPWSKNLTVYFLGPPPDPIPWFLQ